MPTEKRRRGRQRVPKPDGPSPLACAVRDVERMRVIFRQHWGKANRHLRPTREDIATAHWQLSADDEQKLRVHFEKKSQPKSAADLISGAK